MFLHLQVLLTRTSNKQTVYHFNIRYRAISHKTLLIFFNFDFTTCLLQQKAPFFHLHWDPIYSSAVNFIATCIFRWFPYWGLPSYKTLIHICQCHTFQAWGVGKGWVGAGHTWDNLLALLFSLLLYLCFIESNGIKHGTFFLLHPPILLLISVPGLLYKGQPGYIHHTQTRTTSSFVQT